MKGMVFVDTETESHFQYLRNSTISDAGIGKQPGARRWCSSGNRQERTMSRQAGRRKVRRVVRQKRRRPAPRRQHGTLAAPWMAVGTLVASTAVTSLFPAAAAAQG